MTLKQIAVMVALAADRDISSEEQLQKETAKLLDILELTWFHPANERNLPVKYNKRGRPYCPGGAKLKALGVKSGVPDVLIFNKPDMTFERFGLAVELKYGKNRLTPQQIDWAHLLINQGWVAVTCRSMHEVIENLKACGYMKEDI